MFDPEVPSRLDLKAEGGLTLAEAEFAAQHP